MWDENAEEDSYSAEHETYKLKKSPLRERPNNFFSIMDIETYCKSFMGDWTGVHYMGKYQMVETTFHSPKCNMYATYAL